MKKENIYVSNLKKVLKESDQKEVYFITVNNIVYVLKIRNVTPYDVYEYYDSDDSEFINMINNSIVLDSQRIVREIEMSKKCPILPQLKLLSDLKIVKIDGEYFLYYIEEKFEGETLRYKEKYTLKQVNDFLL